MWKAVVVGTMPPFGRVKNVLKLEDRVEIAAACDLNEQWARQCAEECGIPQTFTPPHPGLPAHLPTDRDVLHSAGQMHLPCRADGP